MSRDANDQVQLKLRFREETRAQLEEAAAIAGRSLNSEIVERLDRSLLDDAARGGIEQAHLLKTLERIMQRVSEEIGEAWFADADAVKLVGSSFLYLLDELRPPAPNIPELPEDSEIRAIMEEYSRKHAEWKEQGEFLGRRLTELFLKRKRQGLSVLEEAEERDLETANKNHGGPPTPDLPEPHLSAWQQKVEREHRLKRAENSVVPLLVGFRAT